MKATPLLPIVHNEEQYRVHFDQNAVWERAITHLVKLHQLEGTPVRGVKGSHIVYRVGDLWIKLMAPLWKEDILYESSGLKCVENQLGVPTPLIHFEGELEGWPYLIISHVRGERIGEVFPKTSADRQVLLAEEVARVTRKIHSVVPDRHITQRADWNNFIEERYKNCFEHHKAKKMSEVWLGELLDFVHQHSIEEFKSKSPVYIHADLTWDHFLVENDHVSGVIDFADGRLGHPEYDMTASTAFLFKGHRPALQSYVKGMGKELTERFSEKLLVWTLLHKYSDLRNYFSQEMSLIPQGNFKALARTVYPLV